ncbi:CpaD family pilus assembly protein [Pseudaminobacter sp. NGMCC 1.201702]|uniref:CpaD family pilus assembly protein n=1 Tax=Pseudaminobacter sp. NGMCC 1.201702 TaxID=3391825 RepID=UPI0039EEB9B2
MSKATVDTRAAAATRRAMPIAAILAIALLSGCAARTDSVTVGAIPDDYRTNHPIVIAEKEQVLDLPVAASERGMTRVQKVALQGFLADYDRSAAPVVTILVPSGTPNAVAASEAGRDFARFARARGVPDGRVIVSSYQPVSPDVSAPIRVAYAAMKAQTGPCGRWPADVLDTSENKHYANFGCSYQNNLAAQIANPADLLGPRQQTTIDAENRSKVIDVYRDREIAKEFFDVSEVDY